MSIYIGIDPGMSGAIAVQDELVGKVFTYKLDTTERDIHDSLLHSFDSEHGKMFAVIERVNAMPKQGISSTFKFGRSYGFLRGCLISLGIPFEEVSPAVWQRAMGCLSKGDKNVTKAKAQQLFPQVKVIHATADALLLAEYCRRQRLQLAS
jgi:hypothetical protein